MKTSELVKRLKQVGCRIVRYGANRDIWFSPAAGKEFTVWRHASKEIPAGTANSILKDAGLR